jgi:hypothetical protein
MPEEATPRLGSPPRGEDRAVRAIPRGKTDGTLADPATDVVYYGQRY